MGTNQRTGTNDPKRDDENLEDQLRKGAARRPGRDVSDADVGEDGIERKGNAQEDKPPLRDNG